MVWMAYSEMIFVTILNMRSSHRLIGVKLDLRITPSTCNTLLMDSP